MKTNGKSIRMRISVRGTVQGVGFRPFVYRLANDLRIGGWVNNTPEGVLIEAEGSAGGIGRFVSRLRNELPPGAAISRLDVRSVPPLHTQGFRIRASDHDGTLATPVLADRATCPHCARELFDPANRRFLYPFTNCTACGPRFTIVEGLPYDRPHTTMRGFEMCPNCQREYDDPDNQRFHAQPNACPVCGPKVELWNAGGEVVAERHEAMLEAADAIRTGQIVAVKGLGGFHLVTLASEGDAIGRLRERKQRSDKPFAVMFPSLEDIREVCETTPEEEGLLLSPESPIVLVRRRQADSPAVHASAAPDNPCLGAMLPYTPLHHILLREIGAPVIATSGNLSEEPICFDEKEALERLGGIADLFLVHNRPIARPIDDSVVRIAAGKTMILRRARGYAPLPVRSTTDDPTVLAFGGHLKNTVALALRDAAYLSPHIGDLEGEPARQAYEQALAWFERLYKVAKPVVACDMHPDYAATQRARAFAEAKGCDLVEVQHHHAHIAACLFEHGLDGTVFGVSWDGTGYGNDGTIWGGEFLEVTRAEFRRAACLRPFSLPGGDAAAKEPRRSALAILYEMMGTEAFQALSPQLAGLFEEDELRVLRQMLEKNFNVPQTTSAGRLFDACAALLGLRGRSTFEGQAAMALEFAASESNALDSYSFDIVNGPECPHVDWAPMISGILDDMEQGVEVPAIAARIHNTFAEMIGKMAARAANERVVLSGGCFQNRVLLEKTIARLKRGGRTVYWHQSVPPNDGGLALGQAAVAIARTKEKAPCA